ncbi:hypothetical protein EYF80_056527 [Liparis tanakae]|uniref:Uncharacterized protein n=1 Tax=Liparis tanakae TaxID=230148 RepID=A0A4Z2EWY1_9TELE|nr:hypothetical protein EYF80_056527 [Liparis tanakae]
MAMPWEMFSLTSSYAQHTGPERQSAPTQLHLSYDSVCHYLRVRAEGKFGQGTGFGQVNEEEEEGQRFTAGDRDTCPSGSVLELTLLKSQRGQQTDPRRRLLLLLILTSSTLGHSFQLHIWLLATRLWFIDTRQTVRARVPTMTSHGWEATSRPWSLNRRANMVTPGEVTVTPVEHTCFTLHYIITCHLADAFIQSYLQ